MATSSLAWPLTSLGLTGTEEQLYVRLLPLTGLRRSELVKALRLEAGDLDDGLAALLRVGLVVVEDDRIRVLPLADAVATLLRREAESAGRAQERLARLAVSIPQVVAATARPGAGDVDQVRPLEGEFTSGGNPQSLLAQMLRQSRGDLLWLRPGAWRMPREPAMIELIAEVVASGRRSRAIYPVLAMKEAPDVLHARARVGEQIRLISDLPTQLIVIGTTHAVLPEPWGKDGDKARLLIRQPAVVAALVMLFEQLWEHAAPVPELDYGESRPDLRRFILQMLAAGQKDELIARTLGLSLRTVRRRIADLMDELGADSRFQAGVEAVRRGWL